MISMIIAAQHQPLSTDYFVWLRQFKFIQGHAFGDQQKAVEGLYRPILYIGHILDIVSKVSKTNTTKNAED